MPCRPGELWRKANGCGGSQYWPVKSVGVRVLHDPADVGGDAVHRAVGGLDADLDQAAVDELAGVPLVGEEDAPDAELVARHGAGVVVPAVEVADEAELAGARRPLAVPDARLARPARRG